MVQVVSFWQMFAGVAIVISGIYMYRCECDKDYEHNRAERYRNRCNRLRER